MTTLRDSKGNIVRLKDKVIFEFHGKTRMGQVVGTGSKLVKVQWASRSGKERSAKVPVTRVTKFLREAPRTKEKKLAKQGFHVGGTVQLTGFHGKDKWRNGVKGKLMTFTKYGTYAVVLIRCPKDSPYPNSLLAPNTPLANLIPV